ncbi:MULTISPECIES: OmpA family protein [Paracoccus]|uniref:OmpA family protein n=1 Tax=Paracoccus litorisediminis TaxID=2006130 RepID=A0A844HJE5_9RHOB|nr:MULTISPECIES: OmpA family protein [Paracoccus]MBD9527647.1 OmpA family protein [Paracoccus sp. PAR01]MTH60283.1 OmpA family protein [Paracoccus litorisediminis]
MSSRSTIAVGLVLIGALAACAPDGGEPGHTAQGAIGGAAAGALIAGSRNNSASDAVRGAVVGGSVGAVVGSIADQQNAMRRAINDPNVAVRNDGQNLIVVFPNALLFATSSATLSPVGQQDLRQLAAHMQTRPGSVVVIGHTDSSGSLSYNQTLSEHRARAVAGTLVAGGLAPQRITAVGQGPTRPIASNDTPEGRAQNRRVEIIVRPN